MPDIRLTSQNDPLSIALRRGETPRQDITLTAKDGVILSRMAGSQSIDRAAVGAGDLTLVVALAGTGIKAAVGAGTIAASVSLAGSGAKSANGAGVLMATASLAGSGRKTALGAGVIALSATLTGTGNSARSGAGEIALTVEMEGQGHRGGVTVGGAPALAYFVPAQEGTVVADDKRRERRRQRERERTRIEAQAVVTVAMAEVLNHQRRIEEDDWLLGLADDYVRRAA